MTATVRTAIAGIAATLLVFASASAASADTIPERPDPPIVVDDSLMSEDALEGLSQQLIGLNDAHDMTVGVVAVQSLEDLSVNDFADQVSEEWDLGAEEGTLIVLVADEYQTRIIMGDDFSEEVNEDEHGDVMNEMGDGFNRSWSIGLRTGLTTLYMHVEGQDPHATEHLHEHEDDDAFNDEPAQDDDAHLEGEHDEQSIDTQDADEQGSEEGGFWSAFLVALLIAAPVVAISMYLVWRRQQQEKQSSGAEAEEGDAGENADEG